VNLLLSREQQLLGKWEPVDLVIDGVNMFDDFKSDPAFFDYLIFYPQKDTNLTIHYLRQLPATGKWEMTPSLTIYPYLQGIPPKNYGKFFPYASWVIQKINNNKLILKVEDKNSQNVGITYVFALKKIRKFE